ncbi:hypothetical protein HPB50_023613 [Hyalomma asiaticum]|uniref:Uncharacterized protein n=1 Tax=Hyalomma asiaticum TaxID=266040 RepID=A0ACB7T2R9_HYAAI|nr:hypothetical protein HPB50_023613 [Hyalomma asiaticum]
MGAYYATPELTPEHEFAPEVVGVEHQDGTRVEIDKITSFCRLFRNRLFHVLCSGSSLYLISSAKNQFALHSCIQRNNLGSAVADGHRDGPKPGARQGRSCSAPDVRIVERAMCDGRIGPVVFPKAHAEKELDR